MICLRDWGLISEADDDKKVEIVDIIDQVRLANELVEYVLYLYLPTLAERQVKEQLRQEEIGKQQALCLVAGAIVLKDD